MGRDELFKLAGLPPLPFTFDQAVTDVFDDMLARSIPCYAEVQRLIVDLASALAPRGRRVYDLGCSLGTTVVALASRPLPPGVEVVGVDSSEPMVDEASKRAQVAARAGRLRTGVRFESGHVDAEYPLPDAGVVVMSLLLQFVRPIDRPVLVQHVHDSLCPGGAIILFEKVVVESPRLSTLFVERYHDFKERNGYSQEEIARKRTALENVLVPFQARENVQLLRAAGFDQVDEYFRWLNFVGFVGLKRSG